MPTKKPRHMITETEDIASALNIASNYWPNSTTTELLRNLINLGKEHISDEKSRRMRNLEEMKGSLTGVFPTNYLEDLRNEWPL